MSLMKYGGLLVGAFLIGGNYVYDMFAPKPDAVAVFGPQNEVSVLKPGMVMSDEGKEAYEVFAEANYFGAFALGPDGKHGYLREANDIATARKYALEFCAGEVSVEASGCEIYAELFPADYAPTDRQTVSYQTYVEYHNMVRDYPSYTAYATTGAGHWGYTYDYPSQWSANEDALEVCNEYLNEDTEMDPAATPCFMVYIEL